MRTLLSHASRNSLRRTIAGVALTLLTPVVLLPPAAVMARPLNVEFKFTPDLPPPKNAEKVTTVEGVATLELNGVPLAEETLEAKSALVMAQREEGIEVFPAIWMNALQLQPQRQRSPRSPPPIGPPSWSSSAGGQRCSRQTSRPPIASLPAFPKIRASASRCPRSGAWLAWRLATPQGCGWPLPPMRI